MAHIVVVGAGAAGLIAAIFACGAAAHVTVLERMPTPGRKILISGGGRCNVLPGRVEPEQYHTESFHTFRKIFATWPLPAQRAFFEQELGVALRLEPESGKLFPASDRSADVLAALLARAKGAGARLLTHASVERLEPTPQGWRLSLRDGRSEDADAVILATGGLSVPATGSDGTGLELARRLGHALIPTYAALTPLTTADPTHQALAGISLPVTLRAPLGGSVKKGERSVGGFLFTHRGYSGPAVLDVSHAATRAADPRAQPLWVQWTPWGEDEWTRRLAEGGPPALRSVLREHLPQRLGEMLLTELGLEQRTLATLRREERRRLTQALVAYPLPWVGHEGYKKAEVTGGGVALSEIHPTSMMSKTSPGLFMCGEMLDVFGPIGGYNFSWAWVSGRLAGLGARAWVSSLS